MRHSESSRAWLLIVGSVGFLGLGFYWPTFYSSIKPQNSLATVVSARGTTEWISRQSLRKQKPKKSLALSLNESLATGSDGELVLRFRKGAEIKLLPNSFVTLIRKANSTLVAVRRGALEVIKDGELNSVLVSEAGFDRPLKDYRTLEKDEAVWIDPQSLDTVRMVDTQTTTTNGFEGTPLASGGSAPRLNAEIAPSPEEALAGNDVQAQVRKMIATRVSSQRNHLFRCYSNLLQKQKNAQGKLEVHFTVNNQGKVKEPSIIRAEINDKKFQKCLMQIIQRMDFQPFEGQAVSTLLPLRFEKNLNPIE